MGTSLMNSLETVFFASLLLLIFAHGYQGDVTNDLEEKTKSSQPNNCKCDPCKIGSECQKSIEEHEPKFHQRFQVVEINEDQFNNRKSIYYNSTTYPGERGCTCPYFVYTISNIESDYPDGSEETPDVFRIEPDTGRIFVTQDLPYELFKLTVTVHNTKTGASDETKLTVMAKMDQRHNPFYPLQQDGYHHIQKRSVVPTEVTFTFTKLTPATSTARVGGRFQYELVITFPSGAMDMLIELFAPDNETTVMILCDVTVTKGSNLATTYPLTNITYDSKVSDNTKFDRAIIDPGVVTNTPTNTVDVAASSIIVIFEAVMINNAQTQDGSTYWVSAGAEYNSENEIYVAQSSVITVNDGNLTVDTDPTFSVTGASSIPIGGFDSVTLDMYVPYPSHDYVLKAFTPLDTVGAMSICYARFDGFGNNFLCGNDVTTIQANKEADPQGQGYHQATVTFSSLLNKGSRDDTPVVLDSKISVLFRVMLFNDASLVGLILPLVLSLEVDTNEIWVGSWNITGGAALTGGPIPQLDSSTTSLTNWEAPIGEPFWVKFVVKVLPPTTPGAGSHFVLELVAPFQSDASVFQVCKLQVLSVGADFPCFQTSDFVTKYSTREDNGLYPDRAELDLGTIILDDANGVTGVGDDLIEIEAFMKPIMGHPDAVVSSTHTATFGISVDGSYVSIMSMSVTLTGTTMSTVSNSTAPSFTFSHEGTGQVPISGDGMAYIDMDTTNNILYPKLDLELLMPSDTTDAFFHVCRLAVESNGKNIPCLTPEWANNQVAKFSQFETRIIDRAKISLGAMCNIPIDASLAEDRTRFVMNYRILGLPAVTAGSQHWINAGIMYSNSHLWVGQLSVTAIQGSPVSPSTSVIHSSLTRNDTMDPLPTGYYARFSLLLKLPSGVTFDLKVKAESSAQGFDICSVRVIAAGNNLPCLVDELTTKTETLWGNGGTSSMTADFGVVGVIGSDTTVIPNEIWDDNTAVVEIVGFADAGSAAGSYDLTVDTFLDTDETSIASHSITGMATTTVQSSIPTVIGSPANISLSVGEIGGNDTSTDIAVGQTKRMLIKVVIPEGSLYNLEISAIIPSAFIGKLELCDAAILYVGVNLACVDPLTAASITSGLGIFKDTATFTFGYVYSSSNPMKPGDEVANSIVIEAYVHAVPNGMASYGDVVTVTGTVKTFSTVTVESLDLTVTDPTTFTDAVKSLDGVSNVTLISIDQPATIPMAIGSTLLVGVSVTVPVNSSSRLLFDVELPDDGSSACLTISEIYVIGSTGKNAFCVNPGQNVKGVTYAPTYNDTVGSGQNTYGFQDVGIVTNTGLSHRLGTFTTGDDDIQLQVTIQMADCSTSSSGQIYQLSLGNKIANYIFIYGNGIQVARDGNEIPEIVFDLTIAAESTSTNVVLEGSVSHALTSTAEGKNTTVSVALPVYMGIPATIDTTSTKAYTFSQDQSDLLKITFDSFYFAEVFDFKATLTIDSTFTLPPGYSAADTRFYYWAETDYTSWATTYDNTDWFPRVRSSHGEVLYSVDAGTGPNCNSPLGLASSTIQDCQIAGTKGKDTTGEAKNARKGGTSAWKPIIRDGQTGRNRYLTVYFGNKVQVAQMDIEQDSGMPHRATEFEVSYSLDGMSWFGTEQLSLGPSPADLETVLLSKQTTRYLRLKVTNDTSNGIKPEVGLRFEFFGCQVSSDVNTADLCTNAASTFPSIPADYYPRSFVADINNQVYTCDRDPNSFKLRGNCVTSSDCGTTWTALDKNLGSMIGYESSEARIFGYANNMQTVLASTDSGATWMGIDSQDLTSSQALSTWSSAIDVSEDASTYLTTVLPHSTFTMGQWGALVSGRECYNYKEDPRIRNCDHGCCGDDYEEHCCDATLQIVGCVLGAVVLIGVIIGIVYYCYRQKTKHRQSQQGPGLLSRFGMRSNNTATQQSRIPQIPGRGTQRIHAVGTGNINHAHYNPQYIQSVQLAGPPPPGYLYPGTVMYDQPPMAPTAPMPPPYAMTALAPPPYAPNKPIPPPPEYNSVVNHGYKYGDRFDRMPPPSS